VIEMTYAIAKAAYGTAFVAFWGSMAAIWVFT
jgi:hypothetical protein